MFKSARMPASWASGMCEIQLEVASLPCIRNMSANPGEEVGKGVNALQGMIDHDRAPNVQL